MKKLVSLLFAGILFASVATNAYAGGESNCQPVYGGGQVCQNNIKFTINKLVQSPTKGGNYVENLTINDPRYQAGQNVNFKVSITNSGNTEIDNLNVVDNFPQFLTFVAGVGSTNVGASKINFVVGKISAGQTLDYIITAKAADADKLPANQAVTCVTNNVVATAPDGSNASDNSQVCIEKITVSPTPEIMAKPMIKNVPATGPETDILFGLVSTGAIGMFLRKKIK